jgi:hypothetical protein
VKLRTSSLTNFIACGITNEIPAKPKEKRRKKKGM